MLQTVRKLNYFDNYIVAAGFRLRNFKNKRNLKVAATNKYVFSDRLLLAGFHSECFERKLMFRRFYRQESKFFRN